MDIRKFRKEGRYKWPGSEAGQPAIFDRLVFGEGITTISSGFFCIEGIKTISLPKSFKKIKASNEMDAVNGSFEPYSTTLKKLQVSKKNKKFSVSKGILYSKDKEGNGYISVVLKAVGGESLYLQMNKLLEYIK